MCEHVFPVSGSLFSPNAAGTTEFQEIPLGMSQKNDIKLLRINYLRGPNIWTYRSVLEVWLDLGELEDFLPTSCPVQ